MIPTECWVLPRPSRSKYVGSFPLHFERKLWHLLGRPRKVLQPFGGLAELGDTFDVNPDVVLERRDRLIADGSHWQAWEGDAHALELEDDTYDLVLLDPPYSADEARDLYETSPPRWGSYTREAVRVCKPGGYVAVYHARQAPTPAGCCLVHRVVVLTRTWHAARICMVFRKELVLDV